MNVADAVTVASKYETLGWRKVYRRWSVSSALPTASPSQRRHGTGGNQHQRDLSTQAEIADKLMQLNDQPPLGRNVNAVQAPPTSSVSADVAALRPEVAALADSLKQLHTSRGHQSSQSFRGSRSLSRGRSTSPSCQRGELCLYHEKFGTNARNAGPLVVFNHQPAQLRIRETPRPETNGDPPSRLSPFEWWPFVCH